MTDDYRNSHRSQSSSGLRTRFMTTAAIAAVASAATLVVVRVHGEPPSSPQSAAPSLPEAATDQPGPIPPLMTTTPVSAPSEEPSVRLLTFIAARSRLRAERDGQTRISFPGRFQKTSALASRIAFNEERLFEARRLALESRQRDLRGKIASVQDEIEGFNAQRDAKEKEMSFINEELRAIEKLHTRQLSNISRVMTLRRDLTRAQWDIGSLQSSVARSHLTIKDIEQQIHEGRHNIVVEAEREIRALDLEIVESTKEPHDLPEPLLQLAAEAVSTARR